MKKLLALLLALTMVFTLAACGGKSESKDEEKEEKEDGVAGKYLLVSVELDGEELSEEDMIDEFGDDSYIELEDDGTATLKLEGNKTKMEYKDDEIWAEDDEDTVFEIKIKKDTVIINMEMDDEEAVLTFEKESDDEDEDKDDDKKKDDEEEDEDEDKKKDDEDEKVETRPVEEYEEDETEAPTYMVEDADITGTYYFYSMTMGDTTYYLSDLEAELGDDAKTYIYIEITDHDSAVMYSNGESEEMAFDGSYMWPLSEPDDIAECTIEYGVITITTEGYELILEK